MANIGQITDVIIEDKIREIISEVIEDYTIQARQVSPSGIDSSPLKKKQGVLIPVGGKGKWVHFGIYNDAVVSEGEIKIFSETDDEIVASIYLDNDGKIHIDANDDIIINEGTDNAVRYSELETAFNELKDDFNDLVSAFNSHVHPGVSPGGSSTSTIVTPSIPSLADITGAKIEEVKVP